MSRHCRAGVWTEHTGTREVASVHGASSQRVGGSARTASSPATVCGIGPCLLRYSPLVAWSSAPCSRWVGPVSLPRGYPPIMGGYRPLTPGGRARGMMPPIGIYGQSMRCSVNSLPRQSLSKNEAGVGGACYFRREFAGGVACYENNHMPGPVPMQRGAPMVGRGRGRGGYGQQLAMQYGMAEPMASNIICHSCQQVGQTTA